VTLAYEPLIPAGEVPDYFIYMTLDPSTIDVNIHPTKTEIKFENELPIRQILSSAVRETLGRSNAIPSIDFDTDGAIDIPVYNPVTGKEAAVPQVQLNPTYNPFHFPAARSSFMGQCPEKIYEDFEHDRGLPSDMSLAGVAPFEAEEMQEQLFSDISTPCFQYKNRYIITSLKSGLVLIDQHRAHIRILFEQYISNIKLQKSASQQVLFPETVEFTPSEAALMPTLSSEIRWLGFDLSPMGGNTYAINGVPAGVHDCNPAMLIKEIIRQVIETEGIQQQEKVELLALSLAKSAAIRPGKPLTIEEMEAIAASLFSLEANNITPDGKVIMTILTDDELSKRFKGIKTDMIL
jgi:DNA mismatch repair protein MutL